MNTVKRILIACVVPALLAISAAPASGEVVVDAAGCSPEGSRQIRVTPSVNGEESDGWVVQWYVDGQPVGQPGSLTTYIGDVPGDGQTHIFEYRVLSPDGVEGSGAEAVIEACETAVAVSGEVVVDTAECTDEGSRAVRATPRPGADAGTWVVQWYVDGQPVGQPGPLESLVTEIPGDGAVHSVEYRVLTPEGVDGATTTAVIEACATQSTTPVTTDTSIWYVTGIEADDADGGLVVRSGPSTSNSQVAVLENGNAVTSIGGSEDGRWTQISEPVEGWVSLRYLTATPPARIDAPATTTVESPEETRPEEEDSDTGDDLLAFDDDDDSAQPQVVGEGDGLLPSDKSRSPWLPVALAGGLLLAGGGVALSRSFYRVREISETQLATKPADTTPQERTGINSVKTNGGVIIISGTAPTDPPIVDIDGSGEFSTDHTWDPDQIADAIETRSNLPDGVSDDRLPPEATTTSADDLPSDQAPQTDGKRKKRPTATIKDIDLS